MNKNLILVRDNGDYDYIYGAIILKGNILDTELLQKRIDDMRDILNKKEENGELDNEDFNGEYILKEVLKKYKEYADLEYIPYGNYDVEV